MGWEMGQGKDGDQLRFLIRPSRWRVFGLSWRRARALGLGSQCRESLVNQVSVGPFLAVLIPAFLSLSLQCSGQGKLKPSSEQLLRQLQVKARGPRVLLCVVSYFQLILRTIQQSSCFFGSWKPKPEAAWVMYKGHEAGCWKPATYRLCDLGQVTFPLWCSPDTEKTW